MPRSACSICSCRLPALMRKPEKTPGEGDDGRAAASHEQFQRTREKLRAQLREGKLDEREVEVEMRDRSMPAFEVISSQGVEEMDINIKDILPGLFGQRTKKRRMHVTEAMEYLIQEEENRLIDMDQVTRTAVERAEQSGIIFLDEIDKIAGRERGGGGPDVSREGVQRDILPIVEGTTVNTRYGMVRTDHILFIAAGAFHVSKPSDLIPELQGRFPIRVELHSLTTEDFIRILKEPKSALVKQYIALLETEGIKLTFTDEALQEIAKFAAAVNEATENIGARRLHTIMEKLLDEISFEGPDLKKKVVRIDAALRAEAIDGHRQESGPQPIHPVKPHLRARPAAAPNFFLHRTTLPKRILQALVLASAAGWLFGCGVQGTPHPPRLERPAKITNLTAVQIGQSLEIHFTLPQQTTDGERLTKPLEVEILRAIAPQGAGPRQAAGAGSLDAPHPRGVAALRPGQ